MINDTLASLRHTLRGTRHQHDRLVELHSDALPSAPTHGDATEWYELHRQRRTAKRTIKRLDKLAGDIANTINAIEQEHQQ